MYKDLALSITPSSYRGDDRAEGVRGAPAGDSPRTSGAADTAAGSMTASSTLPHISVTATKVNVDFLSYLDTCPPCRGTFNYLLRKEEGQSQSWFQARIAKLLQVWGQLQEPPFIINAVEDFSLEVSCISLAQCIKGAAT